MEKVNNFNIPNIPYINFIKKRTKFKLHYDLKFLLAIKIRDKKLEATASDLKDTEENYINILNSFKELTEKLELNSPLAVSIVFYYLVKRGYLSRNKKFEFNEDRKIINNAFSYSIIEGRGVCLNLSAMLVDCLQICGYNAAIIGNFVDHKNKKISKFEKIGGNHAFVMIKEDDNYYIYDPTNGDIKTLVTPTESESIFNSKSYKLKIFSSYLLNYNDKSLKLIKNYEQLDIIQSSLNPLYVVAMKKAIINKCEGSTELFEDFYNKNCSNFDKIGDFVDSFGENACKTK